MLDYPKNLEDAKKYKYGQWAGNPDGYPYCDGRCAYGVWSGMREYQCSKRNGHGLEGLYCKQHARIVDEREEVTK